MYLLIFICVHACVSKCKLIFMLCPHCFISLCTKVDASISVWKGLCTKEIAI